MTEQYKELRERAGEWLYKRDRSKSHENIPFSELAKSTRECWCKGAWPLVQMGLVAGLREAVVAVKSHVECATMEMDRYADTGGAKYEEAENKYLTLHAAELAVSRLATEAEKGE